MKRITIFLILICASQAIIAQDHSVGIRLGEPTGITYKRYLNKSKAIEFGLGTAATRWNETYYQKSFYDKNTYNGNLYNSHHVNNIIYFQGRYLLNYPIQIQGAEGKFDWYWGVGAVLKLASVEYFYQSEAPPYASNSDTYPDFDFGPEAIGGLEYKFEDVPITLFAEVSLMVELIDRFGAFHAYLGTGGRYNF